MSDVEEEEVALSEEGELEEEEEQIEGSEAEEEYQAEEQYSDEEREIELEIEDETTENFDGLTLEDEMESSTTTSIAPTIQSPEALALRSKEYKILSKEEIFAEQQKDVETVYNLLQLQTVAHARQILRHFNWNAEKVVQFWTEQGIENTLKEAKVTTVIRGVANSGSNPDDEMECLGCMNDVAMKDTSQLSACGHRFCNECWREYIKLKIEGGYVESRKITCMGHKCGIVLDEMQINLLAQTSSERAEFLKEKYDESLLQNYVADNKRTRYCPSIPHCGYIVKLLGDSAGSDVTVDCECGISFCFGCGADPHYPALCDQVTKWKARMSEDYASIQWITSNTKRCPGCSTAIEKNHGCNHMTCYKCQTHFCWICLSKGGYEHSCSSYTDKKKQTPGESEDIYSSGSSKNLESKFFGRYIHYISRYKAHEASKKFLEKYFYQTQYRLLEEVKSANEDKLHFEEDLQWLQKAVSKELECRRLLMYSNVYSYYTFDIEASKSALQHETEMKQFSKRKLKRQSEEVKQKQELFEKTLKSKQVYNSLFDLHIEQLHRATERLSGLLGGEAAGLLNKKADVQNVVDLANKAISGLLDVIHKEDMQILVG